MVNRWMATAFAALLLAGCGGGDDKGAAPSPTTALPTATASPTASPQASPSASATPTPLTVTLGTVVYSDDFTNRRSGWPEDETEGRVNRYDIGPAGGQYQIRVKKAGVLVTISPEQGAGAGIYGNISVSAQLSRRLNVGSDDLYGVHCRRAGDAVYYFYVGYENVEKFNFYRIVRIQGADRQVLADGRADFGSFSGRIRADCVDSPDGTFTTLALHYAGRNLAEATDSNPLPAGKVGVQLSGETKGTSMQYGQFQVRAASAG